MKPKASNFAEFLRQHRPLRCIEWIAVHWKEYPEDAVQFRVTAVGESTILARRYRGKEVALNGEDWRAAVSVEVMRQPPCREIEVAGRIVRELP